MQGFIRLSSGLLGLAAVLIISPPTVVAQTTPQPAIETGQGTIVKPKTAVARIWHGRTQTTIADEYYQYLMEAGIKKIVAIPGNLGAQVLRRTEGDVTEFTVISYWESREAIRRFAGNDIEKTRHLPKDPEYLLELEPTVKHFDILWDERK